MIIGAIHYADREAESGVRDRNSRQAIEAAVKRAAGKIAPLWPLKHFVAVNPFLGLANRDFTVAAQMMAEVAGARMTMPRPFYAEAIEQGHITDHDLAEALDEARPADGLPRNAVELKKLAHSTITHPPIATVPTVADVASGMTGHDWPHLVVERISSWAASYFDGNQASWRSPWRRLSAYAAWRAEACIDRTPELMGIGRFRSLTKALPASALAAITVAVDRLDIPPGGLDRYFHRLLMHISGWAGYARYLGWENERRGEPGEDLLAELLAVRLSWESGMLAAFADEGLAEAWVEAWDKCLSDEDESAIDASLAVDLVLHSAYEKAWQRDFISKLSGPKKVPPTEKKLAQAAFCIDVRSEVFRRALETADPQIETLGFAGFFGFAIEYVPLGYSRGGAQCPVLLTPKFIVRETRNGADEEKEQKFVYRRVLKRRAAKAWKSFKLAAVSSFGFVETMGLGYAIKLAADSLGITGPVTHRLADALNRSVRPQLGPSLALTDVHGRQTGLSVGERLETAEAVLRAMSLTEGFARFVLLVGHGATTVNNPHATGLDCGACGGHSGEANARVAAAVFNDPAVRAGLAARGISLPEDTIFLGCLHNTTTDEMTIFDQDLVPASHAADLARLKEWLATASRVARRDRARSFHIESRHAVDATVAKRCRDWSQVRPEWGLAGCGAFIVAPRHRTQGIDLGGRSFLHSYDWRKDEDFDVLELIMTAPMVVASWINLQYYGSTVDNRVFGSGDKTLHNVVGALGVLEGNGGDLRVGLAWQSVHDGERLIHEPVRLSALIEAPVEAINAVISKHEPVRQLLDNGWLHLFAIDESGEVSHRYTGGLEWEPITAVTSQLVA